MEMGEEQGWKWDRRRDGNGTGAGMEMGEEQGWKRERHRAGNGSVADPPTLAEDGHFGVHRQLHPEDRREFRQGRGEVVVHTCLHLPDEHVTYATLPDK